VIGYLLGGMMFDFQQLKKKISLHQKRPDAHRDCPTSLFIGYRIYYPLGKTIGA
jgi:hypothetical protein